MPVGPVCNVNIAIRPVGIGDVVDLHMCRKHIDDDPIIQRHDARAELFASNQFTLITDAARISNVRRRRSARTRPTERHARVRQSTSVTNRSDHKIR